MSHRIRRSVPFAAFVSAVAFAGAAWAGPLAPSAGSVASTGKPLWEVEARTAISDTNTPGDSASVYRITQPGAYYLTGNVTAPSGKSGIVVAASNVTIDLNGFTIQGQAGSLDGVTTSGTVVRVAVRNGTIVTMGDEGIELYTPGLESPQNHVVEDVTVRLSGGTGIYLSDGVVRNARISGNAQYGVVTTDPFDSLVEGCAVTDNGVYGVRVLRGTVRSCSASGNGGSGISVAGGTIIGCTAIENATGFFSDNAALITDCFALDNTQRGIQAGGGSLVRGNTVKSSSLVAGSIGIFLQNAPGSRAEGNVLVRQTTAIFTNNPGNLIIGNSMHACTTAVNVAAGNRVGPIVTGTASGTINGNSGGGLGTTDPYANIIH